VSFKLAYAATKDTRRARENLLGILPVLVANTINANIAIVSLVIIGFSETLLGRLYVFFSFSFFSEPFCLTRLPLPIPDSLFGLSFYIYLIHGVACGATNRSSIFACCFIYSNKDLEKNRPRVVGEEGTRAKSLDDAETCPEPPAASYATSDDGNDFVILATTDEEAQQGGAGISSLSSSSFATSLSQAMILSCPKYRRSRDSPDDHELGCCPKRRKV
jgi:hypothetical protein